MIRAATLADAAAIAAVYAPEVLHGTATFEIDPPDAAEFAIRMARVIDRGWPWLVADSGGVVVGYAYAAQFRDRPAYAHTCENSIYIAAGQQRRGIGRALLAALIDASRAIGFREMIAVIGDADNTASIALHRNTGFRDAGRLTDVGLKFGRWLDVVYMQRTLSPH